MAQLARFLERFPREMDAALIVSEENRAYLTGFSSSAGYLLCVRDAAYFLVDFRYYEKACQIITGAQVLLLSNLRQQLGELIQRHGVTSVGMETASVTLDEFSRMKAMFPETEFLSENSLSRLLFELRSVKTPQEIAAIRAAQAITDRAFSQTLDYLAPGRTEKQVAAFLEYQMKLAGADGLAFPTIAVSGKNSSLPHGTPTDKPLEPGDFLTMDFGASVEGYCSDMTRTVCIGEPSELQRQVYQTVLDAQQAAFACITPGVEGKAVDQAARELIDRRGFAGCFGHGLGHSVGLMIHESPCFNMRDTTPVQPGMVITVEPGIYLERRFGVRIEDMVLITESGYENLTKSPKDLLSL